MKLERRAVFEVRSEGRTISGPVLKYGDVSPSHRERFADGSIEIDPDRQYFFERGHRSERILAYTGGGLELRAEDDGLFLDAELPRIAVCDKALEDVKAGVLTGLSVEFFAREERQEAGLRVVERAEVISVALVKYPSYQKSTAEVRDEGLALPFWALS